MGSREFGRLISSIIIVVILINAVAVLGRDYSGKTSGSESNRSTMGMPLTGDSILDPEISWPTQAGLQQTGKVNTVFDCFGQFGSRAQALPEEYGTSQPGFQAPAWGGVDYLALGAIWVGGILGSDTLVSTGSEGWAWVNEMRPPDGPMGKSVVRIFCPADFSMRALFTDTITDGVANDYMGDPYKPLHLRLSNRSHVRRTDPYRDCVLYDLVITNIGGEDIRSAYVGFFWDSDVVSSGDPYYEMEDITGSIRSNAIGYTIDSDGDPVAGQFPDSVSKSRAFAFAFLGSSPEPEDTNFNWWVSNGSKSLDFGPRQLGTPEDPFRDFGTENIGTPLGNANMYYVMSHPEWDYDQCRVYSILPIDPLWMYVENRLLASSLSTSGDTRFLMSVGPFDLPPDSSVRIQFTTFTADSIHTDPNNRQYLPSYPSAYTAMLGIERLVDVAEIARQFGRELLDPSLPPIGFGIRSSDADSIVYEWDPWVYDDVMGYRLLLGKASPAELPHPGVIPPWQLDIPLDTSIELGKTYHFGLKEIDPNLIYVARLCHITEDSDGQPSPPASVHTGEPPAPPSMAEYSFAIEGESMSLRWHPPAGSEIDHFNIYKFQDSAAAKSRYLPFYDTRSTVDDLTPRETVTVDGSTYYYYALEPYGSVAGTDSTFVDIPEEGNTYVVTSVDGYGFESNMSAISIAYVMPPRNRDVLVLTHSSGSKPIIVSYGSIQAFYDSVFAGTGLDYEIFDIRNNCLSVRNCPDWRIFLPFRWVIVDDIIYDAIPYREYEMEIKGFTRYVLSNGNLAYFGGGFETWSWLSLRTPPMAVGVDYATFIRQFFGIDSVFFVGAAYEYPEAINDSLFGFAEAVATAELPGLRIRTDAYPLGEHWELYWPLESPPSVTTYTPNDRGRITHSYRSLYPSSSLFESGPVGVRSMTETSDTYLFGFHLYYMRVLDARGLLGSMMTGNRPPILSVTGEENFETDGLYPDTGRTGTVFTFRVLYDDPEGDPPMIGYPRVCITGMDGVTTESAYVMEPVGGSPTTEGAVYTVEIAGLIPGSYTYRFEARDTGSALAGGEAATHMTGPVVRGDVWHVTVEGNDETGDGSESAPYGSIQHAIDAGLDGDAVIAHDGTYSGAGNRDIDFGGKELMLRSEHGPSRTVIDVNGTETEPHRAFDFTGGSGAAAVVDGFTVSSGYADSGAGAIIADGSPTFKTCLFTGNVASVGPAIALYGGSPRFENCTIADNAADSGGAIAVFSGGPTAKVTLNKCIIAFNEGVTGISCGDVLPELSITDCDIFENGRGDWTGCVSGLEGRDGNFSEDPGFCDAVTGDFSLRAGSCCLPDGNENHLLIGAFDMGCVPTSVDDEDHSDGIPGTPSLSQNYPNPFNSSTTISFSIPTTGHVTVTVFNVLGQRVATLLDKVTAAGVHTVSWDGTGPGGMEAASGVYFYRVRAGVFVETRKMLLVK